MENPRDTLHLVIAPSSEDLTPAGKQPFVISCKVIRVQATVMIFADASSPSMSTEDIIASLIENHLLSAAASAKEPT